MQERHGRYSLHVSQGRLVHEHRYGPGGEPNASTRPGQYTTVDRGTPTNKMADADASLVLWAKKEHHLSEHEARQLAPADLVEVPQMRPRSPLMPAETDAERDETATEKGIDRGWPEKVLRWLVANPIPALTIAGAVLYAMIRNALERFYVPLGVQPEEVGLGYSDVLARALTGVVLYGVFGIAIAFVGWLLLRVPEWYERWRRPELAVYAIALRRDWMFKAVSFAVLFLPLLILWEFMLAAADVSSSKLYDGRPVRPGLTFGAISQNPLGLRAEPVTVEWLGGDAPQALAEAGNLMYLGRSNGVAILYDVKRMRTLRLPDSQMVITRTF